MRAGLPRALSTARALLPALGLACSALVSPLAAAAEASPQRVRDIREAALQIWQIQRLRGNETAMEAVEECYLDVRRNQGSYTREVEVCVTWDYYVAISTVAFVATLPPEQLKKQKIDVQQINDALAQRLFATFDYFGLPPGGAAFVTDLLNRNVMQAVQEQEQREGRK